MNKTGTVLGSAARTATTTSATQTNYEAKGVLLFLNVTDVTAMDVPEGETATPEIKLQAQAIDSVSGNAVAINAAPTAVSATGTKTYLIYPGASAGATQATSGVLPRLWNVKVTATDASSFTYSVSYSYIS